MLINELFTGINNPMMDVLIVWITVSTVNIKLITLHMLGTWNVLECSILRTIYIEENGNQNQYHAYL